MVVQALTQCAYHNTAHLLPVLTLTMRLLCVQVVTAALGIVICYADRSNVSTAILPMAETFGWDKVHPPARTCAQLLYSALCVAVSAATGSQSSWVHCCWHLCAPVAFWRLRLQADWEHACLQGRALYVGSSQ